MISVPVFFGSMETFDSETREAMILHRRAADMTINGRKSHGNVIFGEGISELEASSSRVSMNAMSKNTGLESVEFSVIGATTKFASTGFSSDAINSTDAHAESPSDVLVGVSS